MKTLSKSDYNQIRQRILSADSPYVSFSEVFEGEEFNFRFVTSCMIYEDGRIIQVWSETHVAETGEVVSFDPFLLNQ